VTKLLKIGLWTLFGGIVTFFGGAAQGFGPCGPNTLLGTIMFLGGMLAAVVGLLLTVIGLFFELKGHRPPASPDPPRLPLSD
jgi:hypothetical protein